MRVVDSRPFCRYSRHPRSTLAIKIWWTAKNFSNFSGKDRCFLDAFEHSKMRRKGTEVIDSDTSMAFGIIIPNGIDLFHSLSADSQVHDYFVHIFLVHHLELIIFPSQCTLRHAISTRVENFSTLRFALFILLKKLSFPKKFRFRSSRSPRTYSTQSVPPCNSVTGRRLSIGLVDLQVTLIRPFSALEF